MPENNKIVLKSGDTYNYDVLLFADEMKPDFESVEGLKDALEDKDSFVGSVADLD